MRLHFYPTFTFSFLSSSLSAFQYFVNTGLGFRGCEKSRKALHFSGNGIVNPLLMVFGATQRFDFPQGIDGVLRPADRDEHALHLSRTSTIARLLESCRAAVHPVHAGAEQYLAQQSDEPRVLPGPALDPSCLVVAAPWPLPLSGRLVGVLFPLSWPPPLASLSFFYHV